MLRTVYKCEAGGEALHTKLNPVDTVKNRKLMRNLLGLCAPQTSFAEWSGRFLHGPNPFSLFREVSELFFAPETAHFARIRKSCGLQFLV
jgi:hypothetical protein